MLGLFRKRATQPAVEHHVPEGKRVYAIGDIHGRLDLLDSLIERIDADDAERGSAPGGTDWIFLGDLVDRGQDSAGVVERLRTLSAERGNMRFLTGNHEEVMLLALEGKRDSLRLFDRIGGHQTMLSYGISEHELASLDYDALHDRLVAAVPQSHRQFLESFEDLIAVGDYAFVHAGVHPANALDAQRQSDLRWIRSKFLDHPKDFGKMIVHGHTISDDVEWRDNRIGIDTGAFATGRLTALGLEGGDRWIVQTWPEDAGKSAALQVA